MPIMLPISNLVSRFRLYNEVLESLVCQSKMHSFWYRIKTHVDGYYLLDRF